MNYAVYLRKITNTQSKIIGYQNGQDASQVTYKNMARAQSVPQAVPVATSFSRIDGRVSILETNNSSPTSHPYSGVSNGIQNADTAANLLGKKTHCAVCADPPSSEPYQTIVPCKIFINPVAYNTSDSGTIDPTRPTPGTKPATRCSWKDDTSQVFRDNSELVADQGRQLALRSSYNLPAKLQGLRGPVVGR